MVGTPAITLDGAAVKQGDQIGHGLAAGEHTIAVTATDRLGNTATREVRFSSASIPDVPTELNSTVKGTDPLSAELSARIPGAEGVGLTATFTKADVVLPTAGYQGEAADVPTTLDVQHDKNVDVASLRPLDGATIDTPSSRGVIFQRYDLPLAATKQEPTLRWSGTIDPARIVALRAWNPATDKWVVLTSSRGQAGQETVLTAPVEAGYRDGGVVHVLVTGEDPFADDLSPRDSSATDTTRTASRTRPLRLLAGALHRHPVHHRGCGRRHVRRLGRLAEAHDVETAEEQAFWSAAYRDQMQWIADNAGSRKIAYAAHTGDVIENDYYDPLAKNPDGSLNRPGLRRAGREGVGHRVRLPEDPRRQPRRQPGHRGQPRRPVGRRDGPDVPVQPDLQRRPLLRDARSPGPRAPSTTPGTR